MKLCEPKPIEAVARRIARDIAQLHTPAALAEAFWALDSGEQVQFLEALSSFIGGTHQAQLQGFYIRDAKTPGCETALELFRCIDLEDTPEPAEPVKAERKCLRCGERYFNGETRCEDESAAGAGSIGCCGGDVVPVATDLEDTDE